MKIERNYYPVKDIEEFADEHGLTMMVNERAGGSFYARFKKIEVKEGSILRTEHGNGLTEEMAIRDYVELISNKVLIFDAYGKERREIYSPRLTCRRE